jgi:hypothetical protein
MESSRMFQREDGALVPSVAFTELQEALSLLQEEYSLPKTSLIEAPAFSLAMVARFALGLSAENGLVCGLVRDTIPGAIVTSTLRHLVNGGASAALLVLEHSEDDSLSTLKPYLQSAAAFGIQVEFWNSGEQNPLVEDLIQQCHNVIYGCARSRLDQMNSSQLRF